MIALKRLRLRKVVLVALGGILLAVLALNTIDFGVVRTSTWSAVYIGGWRSMPFDEKVWRINEPVGQGLMQITKWDNRRARMVDDLIAHHLHTGMTKEEVESVLGKFDGELMAASNTIRFFSTLAGTRS